MVYCQSGNEDTKCNRMQSKFETWCESDNDPFSLPELAWISLKLGF